MSWGVGTKLACAYDQPSLGGSQALGNARVAGCKAWSNRLKVSEQSSKLTLPGVLDGVAILSRTAASRAIWSLT